MEKLISGLISLVNGSERVSGVSDTFGKTPAFRTEITPGDLIKLPSDLDTYWTTVKSIENDTSLILTKPYGGTTGSSDYVKTQINEIKSFLNKKIPDMYREEISDEDMQTVTNVISSSYLELLPKIKDMKYLYDLDNVQEDLLPYIAYLVGYQFDESLGQVSTFLQQEVLKRNQVKNAVAWQKLKGSTFGIKQYLKTLALEATIRELWYDSTFRDLLDSVPQTTPARELWHKDITNNSIQLFEGNNGIDTSGINHLVYTIVNGNLVYTTAVNGSIRAEIWQQQVTPISGVSNFANGSTIVNGTLTSYLTEVQVGDKIKLNTSSTWYTVQSVETNISLTLTQVYSGNTTGVASVIKPTKVLATRIIQDGSNNFIYDPTTPNTVEVNLGRAQTKSSRAELFDIQEFVNDILRIKVNGGMEQIVILPRSLQQSVGVVANAINNQITGVVATGEAGYLVLTSQDNSYYTKFEIVADPRSVNETLGIPLGEYSAQTQTKFDGETDYLTLELRNPLDFSNQNAEIYVDYNYIDYVAPASVEDYNYRTGAKSNWFDVELQAKNNAFILLSGDVKAIVKKIETDVKPFHALLRTIRYISGFEDTWQLQPDQPSFFMPWREQFRGDIEGEFVERMRFGFSSCNCQCCLLYDNCLKKIYDGKINYNWSFGIYYDAEACYPRDLLVIYNGYIQKYGGSSLPTSTLTGTITFTNSSTAVSAVGGAFLTEITPGISYVRLNSGIWWRVASVTDNDNLILEQPFGETGGSGINIETMNPLLHTQYRYTLTYITQNIFNAGDPNRLIVYYDGEKYYDKQKNSYCIFHYDLGEYAKIIGLTTEDYTITTSNNKMLIQPYGVKELTGQSTWTNGTDTLVGFNTFYTTEVSIGDWIKPSSIGTAWYQVLNIVDDLNLQLSSNYIGITAINVVTDKQITVYTPLTITLTTGTRTADEVAQEINDQIGQQSTIEAIMTGVVTFTNGDATVTAVGGNFDAEVKPGDWIRPTGTLTWYQVKYVHTNDDLELKITFGGITVSGNADKGYTPVILSWGIPLGFGSGFVRLLANIQLDISTREKGAILLDTIADDAYTVLGFDKLYSKASICFLLYNPSPNSTLQILTLTGDINFTNGLNNVTGVGTLFTNELQAGDLIKNSIDSEDYYFYVTEVLSNTSLTIDGNYSGTTGVSIDNKGLRIAYNSRLTGDVTFINGNTSVTGVNTLFLTELVSGDMIRLPGDIVWGTVNSIINDVSLTLVAGYGGSSATSGTGLTRKIKAINYSLGSAKAQEDLLLAEISS